VQAQYARHARESGHPVSREASAEHEHFGVLHHPLSRMMKVELPSFGEAADGDS